MRKLAKEFGLSFKSEPPRFLDFYLKFNLGKKDLNHIQGNLSGSSVHIYDKIHFSLIVPLPSRTVIEVDGATLGEKDFTLGDLVLGGFVNLTPTSKIRIILQNLRSARS